MKRISIDELIDMVDSRYSLVTIISKRARQIIDGSEVMVKTNTIKPVGIAIEEFHEYKYEPIYDYDKYKKALEENAANESVEEAASDEEKDNIGEE
ncbi:DNA-directed RNA polymerase subunit omega [Sedimentibacter hydroxybenzoicus DSM 7310]|uniref:DNA-directed RNA polymerase subunit omega n=1 Tax=Sedimentibacter hydroxybenzoicus DSM 7310 TaxID=1123245 RepID=A0A974BJA8_SEDHY|nr:DNA-directed RNA polymerase subunit omega [Sedimentibacter hydroxybenzoicus DSM 7310]